MPLKVSGFLTYCIIVFAVEVYAQHLSGLNIPSDGQRVDSIDVVVASRSTRALCHLDDILTVDESYRPHDISHRRGVVACRDVAFRVADDETWLHLVRRNRPVWDECSQQRVVFLNFAATKLHHGECEAQRRVDNPATRNLHLHILSSLYHD